MSLLALLAGPDSLKPAIDDIIANLVARRITMQQAETLVAERDAKARQYDAKAADEAAHMSRAFRKVRPMAAV